MDAPPAIGALAAAAADRGSLSSICERYGVTELSVFGPVVREEARPDRDLDLLYVSAPARHLEFSLNRLEDELRELFGRRVDLVAKAALHGAIRNDVLAEAQTLYARR